MGEDDLRACVSSLESSILSRYMASMQLVEFSLNGRWQSLAIRSDESLLQTLRNRCGILSTKDGCQPQGQCGCCLALIDGLPKVSCAVPTSRVQDKEILTLEGLPEEERRLIGHCFVAAAGLQCGDRIPGFALQRKTSWIATHLPAAPRSPAPSTAISAVAPRTSQILDAIELLAAARRGEGEPDIATTVALGAHWPDTMARR